MRRRPRRSTRARVDQAIDLVVGDGQRRHHHDHVAERPQDERRACAGRGRRARRSPARRRTGRPSSTPTIKPRWRISTTCGSGASCRRGARAGARSSAGAARARARARRCRATRCPAAQASGLPGVGVAVEECALLLILRRGRPRRPPRSRAWRRAAGSRRVMPLATHSRSGATSSCSHANMVPVRPKPVATSSQMRSTSCSVHSSRARAQEAGRLHQHAGRALHQRLDDERRRARARAPRSIALERRRCVGVHAAATWKSSGWKISWKSSMPPTLTAPRCRRDRPRSSARNFCFSARPRCC